jgi:hypothetical protein
VSRGPGRVRRDRQTGCVGNGGGRRLAPNKRLQLTMPADPLRRWVPLLMTLTLLLTTLTLLSSCNGWGWRWRLEFLWRPSPCDSAPYVLLQAEHRPGAGLSLDGRTRLAAVFAPNHTPWRLAAWLCRRKHASAPVGPLPQSRSKRRRTFTTPTESGGNHTSEPSGPAATIDRIPEKTYDFLV